MVKTEMTVTKRQMLKKLQETEFPKNTGRQNILKKNQEFFDRLGLDEARRALHRPKRPRQKKAPAAIVPRQMPARGKQLHPLDEYAVGFDFGTPALDPPALHFSSRRAFLPRSPQATPPR